MTAIWLFRRLVQLVVALLCVSVFTFALLRTVPGDPVAVMLGDNATTVDRDAMLMELGLDQPWSTQFSRWITGIFRGDWGVSWTSRQSVAALVRQGMMPTYELALLAVGMSLSLGLAFGPLSAARVGSRFDRWALGWCALVQSTPTFWIGSVLIFVFSLHLDWFPMGDRESFASYLLPMLTLGLGLGASLFRLVREVSLQILREDYVRTARAKGLSEYRILYRHVLRAAASPVVTITILQLGALLGGAAVTETLFDWPGLGTLMLRSLQARDFPVVQGCVFVISATYVIVGFLGDLLSQMWDPRRGMAP